MVEFTVKCKVCQALLDSEDLFCPNCGTEAPLRPEASPATSRVSTHNFVCQSCGASMSYDASAGTLRCPFCGSIKLQAEADQRVQAPDEIVPFTIDRDQAISIMRRQLGQGFWRPGDLSGQALVVSMTPVYVPYWVFDATTFTYWTADTDQTPSGASGDWYPLTGQHQGRHSGLLIGASAALSSQETQAICPFDLGAGVPPEQVDLTKAIDERFSVPRKYARPLAKQALDAAEADACRGQYVPGRCRNLKINVRSEDLTSRAVLLPVWIMAYRYRDRVFRFLVNGQNGRCTGQAPTSWYKIALGAGLVAVVILLLLFLIRG